MIVKKSVVNAKSYRPAEEESEIEMGSYSCDGSYANLSFNFKGYRHELQLSRVEVESLIHDLNNFIDDTKKGGK